jgi:hypothetical protein
LPDPQRPLRRLTHARSLSRAVTHVAVIGLVAFASAVGISAARGQAPGSADSPTTAAVLPFDLVSRARGAAAASQAGRTSTFELQADPNQPDPLLARRELEALSTPRPTALPTPVAPPAPAPDPPMGVAAPAVPTVRGTGVLAWPVTGGTITTYFSSAHLAIDIAAP